MQSYKNKLVLSCLEIERRNPLPPQRLLFPIISNGSFYMPHPTDRIAHTTACVTPVVEHWLEREIVQCVHHTGSIRRPIAPRTDVLPRSYISLLLNSRMSGYIKNIYIYYLVMLATMGIILLVYLITLSAHFY